MKTINKLKFDLWYADNLCYTYNSLHKAIKMAVTIYKNNEDMFDRPEYYYVKFENRVIVTIKATNHTVIIE